MTARMLVAYAVLVAALLAGRVRKIDTAASRATGPRTAVPRHIIHRSSSQFLLKSSFRSSDDLTQSFGEYYANLIVSGGFSKNSAKDSELWIATQISDDGDLVE